MTALGDLTLSPRKAEKTALSSVTNSRKADIPACKSLIYSRKDEISAWKFRKKLLKIMFCLGAPSLGTPCCGSSGVRELIFSHCSDVKVNVCCVLQYMLMMMGTFAVLAWFGSLIDNLLLTYLIGQYLLLCDWDGNWC